MTAFDPSTPSRTVAFMDIGTNSIRLLVVEIRPNHSYTVLHQLKETVRLGEGEFSHQHLQPEAIDRAVFVATYFARFARRAGASEILAVATAATREADNQQLFLRRLRLEADIEAHPISGLEEARLVYLGVVSGLHLDERRAFFIDIGGGSTEVIVGDQYQHYFLDSLRLGAIRLTSRFLGGRDGPVSPRRYERICEYVREESAATIREVRNLGVDLAIGSSGTIENLADIAYRMLWRRPWQRDDVLTLREMRQVIAHLCTLSVEERRKVPGMNPTRADIIIAGAAIIETFMTELGISGTRVSDRGLREGLLVDYLTRQGHTALVEEGSVRERSVLKLGRTCQFNEAHARKTAHLALQLFDSGRQAGIHRLGAAERELLEYAALLHHIGAFLTYDNYQRHSAYLIRNAELLGFDQVQTALMAEAVLYHRNPQPAKKQAEFAALTLTEQETVKVLGMLLRLAESLDRSQAGAIESARIAAQGAMACRLDIVANQDIEVELWGLRNDLRAFQRTFGRSLEVSTNSREPAASRIA